MNYWVRCLKTLHESERIHYSEFIMKQIKCFIFVAISSITTVVFPNLVSRIIDNGIGSGDVRNIYKYSILLGITGAAMIISGYVYQMSFYRFSQKFVMEIKELVFEKLLQTNLKFWGSHTAGDVFKVLEDDIAAIENMFTRSISSIISNIFIFVGVASYLIYIHTLIGILLIAFTLVIAWTQRKCGKEIERIVYPLREDVAMFAAYTNEIVNNVISVEMCGNGDRVYENYCEKNRKIVDKTLKQLRMVTLLRSIISSYNICGIFVVMFVGAGEVLKGNMSVGSMVSITMYVQWLLGPVASLGDSYIEFKSNLPIFKRVFDVLDTKDVVPSGNVFSKEPIMGRISIKNVKFGYSSDKELLNQFNLVVNPGEIVGITGENGSGKTTIFRLLLKQCEVNDGEILIDDIRIKDYEMRYLTNQIGCFLQDEFIISGLLRDVIDIEKSHSDQEILDIMQEFCLDIKNFPQGLNTRIEENTSNLSGGQVQKIALARLFLQNKAIYLLDEPTAAIDIEAEKVICKVIKKYLQGKTAIIITHRNKILSICNKKIVISQKGKKFEKNDVE